MISETQLQSLITTAAQYFFPNQAVINRYKEVLGICRIIAFAKHGGRSSAGRAPGCGPGCRGFEPRRSPHIFKLMNLVG